MYSPQVVESAEMFLMEVFAGDHKPQENLELEYLDTMISVATHVVCVSRGGNQDFEGDDRQKGLYINKEGDLNDGEHGDYGESAD